MASLHPVLGRFEWCIIAVQAAVEVGCFRFRCCVALVIVSYTFYTSLFTSCGRNSIHSLRLLYHFCPVFECEQPPIIILLSSPRPLACVLARASPLATALAASTSQHPAPSIPSFALNCSLWQPPTPQPPRPPHQPHPNDRNLPASQTPSGRPTTLADWAYFFRSCSKAW